MLRAAAVVALAAGLTAPACGATTSTGFAFGREGGNIRPFTVTIAADGQVRVTGPVHVGVMKLTKAQLTSLGRVAQLVRFTTLPARTLCPNTLPDVATTVVRVGARTIRVHGDCVPRVTRMWNALRAAVKLTS
jgi:hypothetical protein